MRLHDAQQGDRYLLCSDGLSTVVPSGEIHRVLSEISEPEQAARELIALANGSGGPDNVGCVVAQAVELQRKEQAACTARYSRSAPKNSPATPTSTNSPNNRGTYG